MADARGLYINQILNHYRKPEFENNDYYTIRCTSLWSGEDSYIPFSHNGGLDIVKNYIKDLEQKIEELQYIEKIIQIAKENEL